jgi:alkanesulfonate monooxygenase SsuD/methylene tetrahydromethanopterin reductase-like flavin-dependent oxidoreductase (luciferase family)
VQAGGIPVWFGGGATERTARRTATLGDGWLPMVGTPVAELAAGVSLIADACAGAGRDPAAIGVRAGLRGAKGPDGRPDVARTLDGGAELLVAGATGFSLALGRFVRTPDDVRPFLAALARASMPG